MTDNQTNGLKVSYTTTSQIKNLPGDAALIDGLGGTAGFGENVLPANDDGSSTEIDITSIFEDGLNFFGREFTTLWVNNNGGVTFNGPRGQFTPSVITDNNNNPEITPFFADVDTRGGATTPTPGGTSTGSNLVYYDFDTDNDRLIVTWDDVGFYSSNTSLLNAFQLVLTDQGNGDFDIQFRYEDINWTTGNASGGSGGLGGTPARAGFTASTGDPNAYFELPASGNEAGILALDDVAGNTGEIGIWEFAVRSGDINSADLPALPDLSLTGTTTGDPHLVTLDGVAYDFHAAGEFVLLRATNGADFEVQARMTPVTGSDSLTVNSAIAARVGNSNIMIDSADVNPFSVDGVATEIPNFDSIMIGNDEVFRANNVYTIVLAGADDTVNDGDSQIRITVLDGRVDMVMSLNSELAGNLEGLLGDADGDAANDVAFADGTPLLRPFAFEDVYGAYRDDWRVSTTDDSLFTYDTGETLEGFYLPGSPAQIASISDFTDVEIAAATTVLLDAGLNEGTANFNNALLDYLVTGDASYIDSAADAPEIAETNDTRVFTLAELNRGTEGDDTLTGTAGDDTMHGLGGDDLMTGLDGNDELFGGTGNDGVFGGAGDDLLDGGDGNDQLAGSDGNDTVLGGNGDDNMGGGLGDDSIDGGAGSDTIGAGEGNDVVNGGDGDDFVYGGAGNDTMSGGEGNDDMGGSFGHDIINGDAGNDNIGGGVGRDTIDGGTGNDTIGAGEGDDVVNGGDGDDVVNGGGRNDMLDGGAGDDRVNGGTGDDTMTGGEGADLFIFNTFNSGDADVITDFEVGVDQFRMTGVQGAVGAGIEGKFAALNATNTADGAMLSYDGNTILLEGVNAAELGLEDFTFL